jgi:hypothetical protein
MASTKKIGSFVIGRPIKYDYATKLKYLKKLVNYIQEEEYPTIPDFCRINHIAKRRLYEWAKNEKENGDMNDKYPLGEYFQECIDRMNGIQEDFIEKNTMQGLITPAFGIFKLKQQGIGWTDCQDVNIRDTGNISIGLPPSLEEAEFPE